MLWILRTWCHSGLICRTELGQNSKMARYLGKISRRKTMSHTVVLMPGYPCPWHRLPLTWQESSFSSQDCVCKSCSASPVPARSRAVCSKSLSRLSYLSLFVSGMSLLLDPSLPASLNPIPPFQLQDYSTSIPSLDVARWNQSSNTGMVKRMRSSA